MASTINITLLPSKSIISIASSSTISDLISQISLSTSISNPKLVLKGVRVDLLPSHSALQSISNLHNSKLLVIGNSDGVVNNLAAASVDRVRRRAVLSNQVAHPHMLNNTTRRGINEEENYRFAVLKPFPMSIPCFELRSQMLQKLSEDVGILDIMKQNKLSVGILTELHPITDPTLLGLNKNAGEEISIRLLTDDLSGLRSLAQITKVLLHELVHNLQGPHNERFNQLNSKFNKDLIHFREKNGISTRFDSSVWSPDSNPITEQDRSNRFDRRLDEQVSAGIRELEFDEFDEVESRRERMRIAAEGRLLKDKQ